MAALAAIQLGHHCQLGLAIHCRPVADLGQGAATTKAKPILRLAEANTGAWHLIRCPEPVRLLALALHPRR